MTEKGNPMPTLSDQTIEDIASICHAANREYCHTHGDDSQPTWLNAPDWQRSSAIAGVRFALANPDAPDSAQHEAWMRDKLAAGWRYGDVKRPEAKEHPSLVSFDRLPPHQQRKDALFRAIVKALTAG